MRRSKVAHAGDIQLQGYRLRSSPRLFSTICLVGVGIASCGSYGGASKVPPKVAASKVPPTLPPKASHAAAPASDLWAALKRTTGFSDAELGAMTKELSELPTPSQQPVWRKHVHCDVGTCAGEGVARLIAALGEKERMPLRGFEPFKGDPLYEYWNIEDRTEFHSWVTGEEDSSGLQALVPEGQSLVIPRWQGAEFVRRAKEIVLNITGAKIPGTLGRCLEWDTPFYIVKGFGHLCHKYDVLTYANIASGQKEELVEYPQGSRWMQLDIISPPEWFPGDYGLVVCLFVLEHVTDPKAAMAGVAHALIPGGFALLGAPFVDGIHACPDDYFRYTPHGLRRVAEDAGLEVLLVFAPGNPVMAAGEFIGMKSSYWSQKDLFTESDSHPLNVFVLARKSVTARWWRPPRSNDTVSLHRGGDRARGEKRRVRSPG